MTSGTDEHHLRHAARRLMAARRVVVFTGAGVSRESGIATFRDVDDGLWTRYDPMEMATREGYVRDPEYVWGWYEHRFGLAERAAPNAGHRALAAMETLLPELTVVTQNVDGLHARAGSSDVLELHGSIHRFRCLSRQHRDRTVTGTNAYFTLEELGDQTERPPRCPYCGELVRPDVVWFGEMLDEAVVARAFELARACDVMLVVGTSGVVQPAASLPHVAQAGRAFIVDVNPEFDEVARTADLFLQGAGGDVLPWLLDAMHDEATRGAPDAHS